MGLGARHFAIGKETTYGTGVTPTEGMEALSDDVQMQREVEKVQGIRLFAPHLIIEKTRAARGTVPCIFNFEEIGLALKNFFGGVTTTGAGPFTHTFPPSAGIPAGGRAGFSVTAEMRRDGALNWRYVGGKIVALALSASVEKIAQIDWGYFFKDQDNTQSPGTPTFPTPRATAMKDISASFDGTALDLRSIDISAEFGVDEPYGGGSALVIKEPQESVLVVAGTTEAYFDSMAQYDKFKNFSDVDVAVVLSDGTLSLTLNMNKTKLLQATPPQRGRERLIAAYEFEAYFDVTATQNLQAILVNNDASIP